MHPVYTAEQHHQWLSDYQSGLTITQIVQRSGASVSCVFNALKALGVVFRGVRGTYALRAQNQTARVCSKCRKEKDFSEFTRDGSRPNGRSYVCQECWKPTKRPYKRTSWLRTYGLTEETYQQILENQHGKCAICGGEPSGHGRNGHILHIDHNHITGKVRGLLCTQCNVGLGSFQDRPDLLDKAKDYLLK